MRLILISSLLLLTGCIPDAAVRTGDVYVNITIIKEGDPNVVIPMPDQLPDGPGQYLPDPHDIMPAPGQLRM